MKYVLALGILLMTVSTSFAGMIRLGWNYEGAGHLGFRLYYGKTSHVSVKEPTNPAPDAAPYEMMIEILDPTARVHEMVLPEGKYYFRLTTMGIDDDSVFTAEEPMAAVGIDAPTDFEVEWIITKTTPIGREEGE